MKITATELAKIYDHAAATYPHECFGFLVGRPDEDWVTRAVTGSNRSPQPERHFEMDPIEFVQTAQLAEAEGLDVLGFYHAHPDGPAIPSQADLQSDVSGWRYLMVGVYHGRPLTVNVWQLASDAPRRFVPLPLEIVDSRSDD